MKLLNLNIGINIDNTKQVISLVKDQNPDFATFQEAINATEEGCYIKYHSKNELEKVFEHSAWAPLFIADSKQFEGKTKESFGGKIEQGSLLISQHEILREENQFYYNEYRYGYDITHFHETDWCRSLQNVIVNANAKQLQILNVHGIWNKGKVGNRFTHQQTDFILSKVREDIPCILVGDFNLIPESDDIKKISNRLDNLIVKEGIKSTRTKDKPQLVCDYIFVNHLVKVNSLEVLSSEISDHLPLLLDFEI